MIAILLSFLPSWLVSLGADLIGAAGLAAIVYSLLPVSPYRRTVQLAGTAAICWACWQYGVADAQGVREATHLRAEVERLEATIGDRERRLAEYRIIVEAGAAREAQAARDIEALQTRNDDYDADVARAHEADPASAWRFDRARLGRLCRLAPRACAAAPGGR